MAILVIVATLLATYLLVNAKQAVLVASDSRWSALFVANLHSIFIVPNIFVGAKRYEPLNAYWSLAIEEQFYLVYPALFFLLTLLRKPSLRVRLFIGLSCVLVSSLMLSVFTSRAGWFSAYYGTPTRVWELTVGCLLAVGTPMLKLIPSQVASLITWIGIAAIAYSGISFSLATPYPGAAALIPVAGTALIIAGGTPVPRWGLEAVLRLSPFRWIALWSFSWYLWHLPIITIAAEASHIPASREYQPTMTNLLLALLALVLAAATYFLIENPIRHAGVLIRHPVVTLGGALLLVTACVAMTFAF